MRTLAATLVAVAGMFLIVVGAVVAVMGALGTLSQAGGLDLGYQPILFLVGGLVVGIGGFQLVRLASKIQLARGRTSN
jgi:hypothetical protein